MSDMNKIFRKVFTLMDPISKQRINIPVRGQNCNHVECFDKDSFLRSNRRKLEWACPICSQKIKEDQLIVDGLFSSIIAKTFTTCTATELDSQGGWSPVYHNKVFRVRTVDLENDLSEGDEEEEEEEEEMKSPEGPLSPVDVPPEPEEPEIVNNTNEFSVMNGGGDEMSVTKEAESQTPGPNWSHNFEVEKGDSSMDANEQSRHETDFGDSDDRNITNEPENSSIQSTVIQRIEDDHDTASREQEMEEAD